MGSTFPEINAAVDATMLARPIFTKRSDQPPSEKPKDQVRPAEERFLLQVDRQTKRSFSSKDAAITAGGIIKKVFPIVMVTIVDTNDGSVDVIRK
jgi:hypothetical protein